MWTLATILDNPGEPEAESRYRDPHHLRALGYSDLIVYSTTGLSGLLGPQTVGPADIRRWVEEYYARISATINQARAAGLRVWLTYDAPTLARELVGGAMTCVHHPKMLCPASNELMEMISQCVDAMIGQFDQIHGLVLRLGDSDAHRLPYLMGNDLYAPHCARCSLLGRADRLEKYIRFFHEQVVARHGRHLIVRAWNVKPGGLHDNPELCQRLMSRLPEDERLIFSFKFTQTDFWRYQKWNPSSLVCGDRPVIYELQCQREFEAKGAIPNYQAPLWRDGMPELPGAQGLAQVAGQVNITGLWAWVRGGGWGGPYVNMETENWIDANVVAAPKLAADPKADVGKLADEWIAQRLNCTDEKAAGAIRRTLLESPKAILESFYIGPYARIRPDSWHPSANFIQDDQIDAEAAWTMIQRLPEAMLDEVVTEKSQAERAWAECAKLMNQSAAALQRASAPDLVHTLDYAQTLVQTLHSLLGGLVAWRRMKLHPKDATLARSVGQKLGLCQGYWNHHQRFAGLRGTASAFQSENLWDFTQSLMEQAAGTGG